MFPLEFRGEVNREQLSMGGARIFAVWGPWGAACGQSQGHRGQQQGIHPWHLAILRPVGGHLWVGPRAQGTAAPYPRWRRPRPRGN